MMLDLPLSTAGLQVGVGQVKAEPPLALPLATSGLSTAVGGIKPNEPQADEGDNLQLPLATASGIVVAVSSGEDLIRPRKAAGRAAAEIVGLSVGRGYRLTKLLENLQYIDSYRWRTVFHPLVVLRLDTQDEYDEVRFLLRELGLRKRHWRNPISRPPSRRATKFQQRDAR